MPAGLALKETQVRALRERSREADRNGNTALAESLRSEAAAIQHGLFEEYESKRTHADYAARESYRKATEKANDELFPGCGRGELGSCVVPVEALIAGASSVASEDRR
jgi:hypothetical protein